MKRLLIALICATLPAIAQIPSPQINLTGNIGCAGFPCLNSGTLIMSADADRTMTALETSAFYLKVTSSVPLTATRNLIAPLGNFPFTIENATTGGQAIQIIGTTGTGVTIPNGQTVAVWNDGTNFVQIGSAGGGIPGGSNTDVQYNNSGAFGGYPLTNFILATGNQTITYNTNGASTLTIANPNAGSGASSGYLASNGTDFLALELAGTGTSIPGAASFVISNATAPLDFQTGGGPILFNAPNTNISGALNYAADTGAANAYVVAPPSCVSATHAGTTINFKAANASTGASTLVYCTGSPVTLYKNGSTALTTGDILAGAQYSARYDGTNWQLLNSSLVGGSGSLPSGTGVVKVTSGTGALASPITDYQVPIAVSLANYSASNLPVTYGNVTSGSNSITVQNAAGWANGMGIFIPGVSTSGYFPATGVTCDNVTVSGNTITMFNVGGSACDATWTAASNSLPIFHFDMTHGAITSGSNSLTVTSAVTFANGQGIMVKGAGTAGADLICPVISVSGTTITLFQANGSTACNAGTTVTTAQIFHDDTNALSLALAAAESVPGSSLRIPTGAYFLSSENDVTNAITLLGDGAQQSAFIVDENAINALAIKSSGVTGKDFGMFMPETITPTSGTLLSLCDVGGADLCFNDNLTRLMLYWGWNQFAVYNKTIQGSFTYSMLHAPVNAALYVDNPPGYGDFNFTGLQAQNCNSSCTTGTYGLLVDAADANAFNSDKFNSFIHNIWITGNLGVVNHLRFNNVSFEKGSTSTGSAIQALGGYAVSGIQFNGGEMEDNLTIGNGVVGTQLNGLTSLIGISGASSTIDIAGQGTTAIGNFMTSCTGDCFRLEATAQNATLTGNHFNTGTGWGINDLETVSTGGPNVAHSNTFSNMASGNSNVPAYQQVDQFAGTSGTLLTSHVSDTGQTWTYLTADGGANLTKLNGSGGLIAATTDGAFSSSLVPSSPNYTVSANINLVVSGGIAAVEGRVVGGASQAGYRLYEQNTVLTLYAINSSGGVEATIGTHTVSISTGAVHNIALVMNGSTISAVFDGSTVITGTDTSLTAAGSAGMYVGGSAGTIVSDFKVANNSGLVTQLATQEYVQDYLSGLQPTFGYTTLSSGTITITNAAACTPSATCVYKLTNCGTNSSAALGTLTIGTITAGTSFVINSESAAAALVTTDNSHVCWQIN